MRALGRPGCARTPPRSLSLGAAAVALAHFDAAATSAMRISSASFTASLPPYASRSLPVCQYCAAHWRMASAVVGYLRVRRREFAGRCSAQLPRRQRGRAGRGNRAGDARVHHARDGAHADAVLHAHGDLRDQVARHRADDGRAEDLSPSLTHEILTKPRVTPSHLQRSTASSGRMYVSYAMPAVSSSFSYSPTCAISGSVYLRRQWRAEVAPRVRSGRRLRTAARARRRDGGGSGGTARAAAAAAA